MIRTTHKVVEVVCKSCYIVHLLGETFNGQRCCDFPNDVTVGSRIVVRYEKTIEEEKAEDLLAMTGDGNES